MASKNIFEIKEVLEHMICPICFENPEAEVYQCVDGHEICKKCHSQLTECPQCRVPFDATRPIRNRHFERILESLKADCTFKLNGCSKRLSKHLISEHEESCCFNFEKYGRFVNICELIGYSGCNSQVNIGNTEEIIQHLLSTHACIESQDSYGMELMDFQVDLQVPQFWTPIITNVKEEQSYLLNWAVLKLGSFGIISLWLPYSHGTDLKSFVVFSTKEDFVWKQTPINLKTFEFFVDSSPLPFHCSWLDSQRSEVGSILINVNKKNSDLEKGERFICAKFCSIPNPMSEGVLRWSSLKRSSAAHKLFYQEWDKCLKKTCNITSFIKQIFVSEILPEDLEWLRAGALFLTAQFGSQKEMESIIKNGFKTLINDKGETPLHLTLLDEDKVVGLKKAKLLMENPGVNVHLPSLKNQSLLHFAAKYSSPEAVQLFLNLELEVNKQDKEGSTPLHLVAENKTPGFIIPIAKLLLENGADGKICNSRGENPLRIAINFENVKLQRLICTRAFTSECNHIPMSSREELVPILMSIFEDSKPKKMAILSAAMNAATFGGVEALKYLLEKKVDFNGMNTDNVPIYYATMFDKNAAVGLEKIKFLVESNAVDIQILDFSKKSILHYAAMMSNVEAVRFLVGKGLDVNAVDMSGHSPLHAAVKNNNEGTALQVIKVLLENGASCKIKNVCGLTPLSLAVKLDKKKIFLDKMVKLLQAHRN